MEYTNKLVTELIPYASNARTHSEEQVTQIASSIREFGFINPIIIDDKNNVIAGHGRLLASKKLGLKEVPTLQVDHLTDTQRKAYILADNQLALNAGWDTEMLKLELAGLDDVGFNLELLGFDLDALGDLGVQELELEEQEVPEPAEDPISKLGDLWTLGNHRLMCGDSTSADEVEKLMGGQKADLVFTDPPYNTGMTAKSQSSSNGGTLWKGNSKSGGKPRLSHMFDDKYTDDEWQKFIHDFCCNYDLFTKKDVFIYICLDWRRSYELVPHLKKLWSFTNLIIWDKMVHGLGSDYKYTHEFIHVCKKGKPPLAKNKEGEKEYQDVWRIQRKMGRDEEHATKKPIELCERAIRHGSLYKNIVLDLFGGSGSTLIASEKNNRICYMMELDPRYCDVIIKRWQNLTGNEAVLESTGETYNSLEA